MTHTTLLTDHPAWTTLPDGTTCRLVAVGADAWFMAWDGITLVPSKLSGHAVGRTVAAVETLAVDLPPWAPRQLTEVLSQLGTVHRLPSPTLWEAITSGLLRRIIRAPQARALYQRWITAYGAAWETPAGVMHTVPGPDEVLDLTEEQFVTVGAALHRTALPAAAAAYLEHGEEWARR